MIFSASAEYSEMFAKLARTAVCSGSRAFSAAAKPKLIYFNLRARGETTRLILAEAKVDYEDFRVERKDWPALKKQQPFWQMPVLEMAGMRLAQSAAINRYLATKYKLVGATPEVSVVARDGLLIFAAQDAAFADSVAEAGYELRFKAVTAGRDNTMLAFLSTTLVEGCEQLEALLKASGTGFFGKQFTYADLVVFNAFDSILPSKPDALNAFPLLKAHFGRVGSRPAIAHWVSNRPKTER